MKKNEFKEIQTKSVVEIDKKVKSLWAEIQRLQLDMRVKRLKNVQAIGNIKKNIARLLTIFKQKEIYNK